jgi:hypothetical protein
MIFGGDGCYRSGAQNQARAVDWPEMPERRFPPPWSIEDIGACFVVKDGGGQKLAYVYYEDEPGRRSSAKLLTRDDAWPIAAKIVKV